MILKIALITLIFVIASVVLTVAATCIVEWSVRRLGSVKPRRSTFHRGRILRRRLI